MSALSFAMCQAGTEQAPCDHRQKLEQMALRLAPLVQVNTSLVHPEFPRLLLNFWLLTSDQLDSLMEFYHQKGSTELMGWYPRPVGWEEGLGLERKRRRFGRFIGLRGCESPVVPSFGDDDMSWGLPPGHQGIEAKVRYEAAPPPPLDDNWSSSSSEWEDDRPWVWTPESEEGAWKRDAGPAKASFEDEVQPWELLSDDEELQAKMRWHM